MSIKDVFRQQDLTFIQEFFLDENDPSCVIKTRQKIVEKLAGFL